MNDANGFIVVPEKHQGDYRFFAVPRCLLPSQCADPVRSGSLRIDDHRSSGWNLPPFRGPRQARPTLHDGPRHAFRTTAVLGKKRRQCINETALTTAYFTRHLGETRQ
jgi:hypothetical protein